MKRREFIAGVGGMVLSKPLAARAQQTGRLPIVAFVHAVIAPAEMAGLSAESYPRMIVHDIERRAKMAVRKDEKTGRQSCGSCRVRGPPDADSRVGCESRTAIFDF
jgi:hypothetical protein